MGDHARPPSCQHCQRLLQPYLDLAARCRTDASSPRFCVLNVDHSEDAVEVQLANQHTIRLVSHLTTGIVLAVQTPIFLVIEDGVLKLADTSMDTIEYLFTPVPLTS